MHSVSSLFFFIIHLCWSTNVWINMSWIYLNHQALRLTALFTKNPDPLYPYQSQVAYVSQAFTFVHFSSSSLVVTCSYFNLSPVRGRDSCCSQCSHWQLLQLFMFPQRAFLIWCRLRGRTGRGQWPDPKKVHKTQTSVIILRKINPSPWQRVSCSLGLF